MKLRRAFWPIFAGANFALLAASWLERCYAIPELLPGTRKLFLTPGTRFYDIVPPVGFALAGVVWWAMIGRTASLIRSPKLAVIVALICCYGAVYREIKACDMLHAPKYARPD